MRRALDLLAPQVAVGRVSSLYETDPVGYREQAPFLNAVAATETALEPRALLRHVKWIEQRLGRAPSVRWGPRVVDLDILTYDALVLDEPDLQLPHPRLAERAFVLVPLAEIAPDWRHPALNITTDELLAALGPVEGVRLYKQDWWPS